MKKKVLHILWTGGIGGAEEYVTSLVEYFDMSRFGIELCILSQKGAIYQETVKRNKVPVTFIGMKNGFDIVNAMRFAHYLFRGDFDLLHFHTRNILSTLTSLFFIKTPKIITHHLSPGDVNLLEKSKLFYRLFGVFFKKIIAISFTVKNSLIKDMGIRNAGKIEVVYNGVDLNKFSPRCTVPEDLRNISKGNKYVIGFTGRMVDYKRPSLFVSVASELLKLSKKYYFIMVGDGPELENCKEMIQKYKISANIKLLGFRRDIPNIISLFDSILFTSVGEGFGIVLIEAMAMDTIVFAVNDGAVSEILNHRENGILFDTEDPEVIARQILEAIKNRELMQRIRKQGVKDVRAKFSIEVCARQIENLYEKILSDARA